MTKRTKRKRRRRKSHYPKYKLLSKSTTGEWIDESREFSGKSPLAAAKKAWNANKRGFEGIKHVKLSHGGEIYVFAINAFAPKNKKGRRKMRSKTRRKGGRRTRRTRRYR